MSRWGYERRCEESLERMYDMADTPWITYDNEAAREEPKESPKPAAKPSPEPEPETPAYLPGQRTFDFDRTHQLTFNCEGAA